jgi:hypothetical protein
MGGVRREKNKIDAIVNAKTDKFGRYMAVMTIVNKEAIIVW